jgi:RHS repeat-associated protein
VAASDPNHPNPFLFTARRFDSETGLYYYRTRYYSPYIGRFLQTDPAGYTDGMNMYACCRNNPVACVDPSGMIMMIPTGNIAIGKGACGAATLPGAYVLSWKSVEDIGIDKLGAAVEVGEITKAMAVAAMVDLMKGAAGVVGGLALSVVDASTATHAYRAFVEIQDYCDSNLNGIMDSADHYSDAYWIELFGVYETSADMGYWNDLGYDSAGAALSASIVGYYLLYPMKDPTHDPFAGHWNVDGPDAPYEKAAPAVQAMLSASADKAKGAGVPEGVVKYISTAVAALSSP